MYLRAQRYAAQGQRVAHFDFRLVARHDIVAHLQAEWRQDIALLAVGVVDQGYAGRAVGVVLDGRDLAGYVEFVPLEIYDPIVLLVPAAAMARRNAAHVVAATRALLSDQQRLLGLLL